MVTPPPCWQPRSSISANTRCGRPRLIWPKPGCRCGWIPDRRDRSAPARLPGVRGGCTRGRDFAAPLCYGVWPVDANAGIGSRSGLLAPVAFSAANRCKLRRENVWEPCMSAFTIHDLEVRVHERAAAAAENSYTRKLLDKGVAHCAKKLGEEAVEVALAAVAEDREHLIAETADLLYHLFVVLEARGVKLSEVEAALGARTVQSGLGEKASRKGG